MTDPDYYARDEPEQPREVRGSMTIADRSALALLDDEIGRLDQLLDALRSRLETVIVEHPEKSTSAVDAVMIQSPLRHGIDRLSYAIARGERLLADLDL